MDGIAKLPQPPYYAVIFVAKLSQTQDGYADMASRMEDLGSKQPGFLGIESVEQTDGLEITVSYWRDEESIRNWRQNLEHRDAQRIGREKWYDALQIRVARVERAYGYEHGKSA